MLWPYGRAGVFELAGGADRTGLWRGSSRPACVHSALPEQSVGWTSREGAGTRACGLKPGGQVSEREKVPIKEQRGHTITE